MLSFRHVPSFRRVVVRDHPHPPTEVGGYPTAVFQTENWQNVLNSYFIQCILWIVLSVYYVYSVD